MADWILGLSQLKSLVQLTFLDTEGAVKTQKNFVKKSLVVSQVVGGFSLAIGAITHNNDWIKYGKEALVEGTKTIGCAADQIPGVGHGVGGLHYWLEDTESTGTCMKSMISATRAAFIMGFGTSAFMFLGPTGATVAGVASGTFLDGILSLDRLPARGFWSLGNAKEVGDVFDILVGVVADGWTGYNGGTIFDFFWRAEQIESADNIRTILDGIDEKRWRKMKFFVVSELTDSVTGKKYYGANKRFRSKVKLTNPKDPKPNLFVEKVEVEEKMPIDRSASTCAETHVYHQLLKERPGADLTRTRINTFTWENGQFKNVLRCDNCMTRAHAMGGVLTDPVV